MPSCSTCNHPSPPRDHPQPPLSQTMPLLPRRSSFVPQFPSYLGQDPYCEEGEQQTQADTLSMPVLRARSCDPRIVCSQDLSRSHYHQRQQHPILRFNVLFLVFSSLTLEERDCQQPSSPSLASLRLPIIHIQLRQCSDAIHRPTEASNPFLPIMTSYQRCANAFTILPPPLLDTFNN